MLTSKIYNWGPSNCQRIINEDMARVKFHPLKQMFCLKSHLNWASYVMPIFIVIGWGGWGGRMGDFGAEIVQG